MKKRIISILLVLVLVWGTLPVGAFAAGRIPVTPPKAAVTGTKQLGEVPEQNENGVYQLGSAEDLIWFAEYVNEDASIDAELTADINLEDIPWTPIGATSYYAGHFNGNGFTVSGLNITVDSADYPTLHIGFFADAVDAVIENLKLSGTITVTGEASVEHVGGVAGLSGGSTLRNCQADIAINIETDVTAVGGLIGWAEPGESFNAIEYCASRGDITLGYAESVGGLIGHSCSEELLISYCYRKGNLTTEADMVGGLIGCSEDSVLTVVHSYNSSSCDAGSYLPEGLETTGLITGGYVGELFGCLYAGEIRFDGVYCIAEIIDGEGNFIIYDFENDGSIISPDFFETAEAFLDALNSGEDAAAYVIDESASDLWPVLAWELKEGASPDEQLTELQNAKDAARAEIEALLTDTYKEENYEAADWAEIISYRDAALTAIDEAADQEAVTAALSALKTNLQSVPTAAGRLDAYKEAARAEVETAYSADQDELTAYIKTADKLGLMHDLKEQFLKELNGYLDTLLQKKQEGLAAVNAAASKADVDSQKVAAISALDQAVADAKAHRADNGVTDKWNGIAKVQPSGSGTEASPYQISNGAELAWFAEQVNQGRKDIDAILTADIDLNEKEWTPIAANATDADGYSGVFDGNGHQVHGLAMTVTKEGSRSFGGLFGNIGKNGIVKNVSVAGIVKQMLGDMTRENATIKSYYAVGGIAGRSSGVIYHCEGSVVFTNGTTYSTCNNIGGIVGYQLGGIIEGCTSYAVLYKNGSANFQSGFGGVTGQSNGASLIRYTDSYANIDLGPSVLSTIGGITGSLTDRAQIRECRNFGTVVNGCGIAGNVLGQAGVSYVRNDGTVSGKNGIGESGIRPAAGIIGKLNSSGTVSYLYNSGACSYGLINEFKSGTVNHAQSSSGASLWGTVDAQKAFTTDCLKVPEITPYTGTEATGQLAWAKLEATQTLLGQLKTTTDRTYGAQSAQYNAIVLQYIRKVELAGDADAINSVLAEANAKLDMVHTQLEAEKENVISAFESYVSARVYDAAGLTQINALLDEAKAAAKAATTLDALNNVKEAYLGTGEQSGKLETECDTYTTKAQKELYNAFIYDKKYRDADMAAMLSLYEQWAVRIQAASGVDAVDTVFAEARFAMNEAASKITETDTAPDMEAAKEQALELAKEAAAKELKDLAESYQASMQTLVDSTNGKGYAPGFVTAIGNVKNDLDRDMDAVSQVDFASLTDYSEIETAKNAASLAMQEYANAAADRVHALIGAADEALSGAWDGVTVTEPGKAADGTYQISNGAELAWIAKKLKEGFFVNGQVNAVLTQDIDLGYNEWSPIGIKDQSGYAFTGTFDGNGHTIKGLYFSKANDSGYYGLFGVVRGNAVIKDLTVKGIFQLEELGNADMVGSIVAKVTGYGTLTLENCASYVDVIIDKVTNSAGSSAYVGGLVGSNSQKTVVTDSAFKGSVTVNSCNTNVRGIGGVIGAVESDAELRRCVNYGAILVDKAYGVGGIVGLISGYGNTKAVTITDCANLGNITNDPGNVMNATGGTGGIVGIASRLATTISGCYNTGTITVSKLAGGILGGEYWNYGIGGASNPDLMVENCYNAGMLVGPNNQTASKIGSLVGYPIDGIYKDGLYVLDGTAQAAMGWKSSQGDRVYPVSADELIQQFADGTRMIKSIAGLNHGYPVFVWQLLDMDHRQAVIDYLNHYFETNIHNFASAEQKEEILNVLNEQSTAILTAADVDTILTAYEAAMKAMGKDALLTQAKENAAEALDNIIQEYLESYPMLSEEIKALKDTVKNEIEAAQKPSEIDIVLDQLDAAVVDLLIGDIGTVNNDLTEAEAKTAKEKIAIAEEAYHNLSETKKHQVSKFITLGEAKAAMAAYEQAYAADKAAAAAVTESIQAIGEVSLNRKDAIETALKGYAALTDKQKAMVSEASYKALQSASKKYAELAAAYEADQKAAQTVMDHINAIGTVTLESKDAITKAINSYNALTDAQKKMISEESYNTIQAASKKYGELAAAYEADQKAVQAVLDSIQKIGNVTLNSKAAISSARTAYDALTDAQKAMVSADTLKTLAAAETQYAALVKANEDKTDGSGKPDPSGDATKPTNPDDSTTPNDEPTTPETNGPSEPDPTTPSAGEGEDGKDPDDAAPPEKAFDWSVVWSICAIIGVALIAYGIIRWFVAAKGKKRR